MPSDDLPVVENYDRQAEAYNWRGPELVFGLAYEYLRAGESVLDLGIGTGLGSARFHQAGLRVFGMDRSSAMLEACRRKGFTVALIQHDLTVGPYPYDTASLDHAVCIGVLDFLLDLQIVFDELARILRDGGVFVFAVAHRAAGESPQYEVDSRATPSGTRVTLYRRGTEEIHRLLQSNGFQALKSVEFSAFMDPEQTLTLGLKAYVARRIQRA